MKKSYFLLSIESLQKKSEQSDLKLKDIFHHIGDRGHLILILILSLPFLLPIPLPGLSTPFGILISILSFVKWIGKKPWLPKRYEAILISTDFLKNLIEKFDKIWTHLEKIIHPRFPFLFQNKYLRLLNFILVSISALLLALPLPIPFTNSTAAIVITLNTLGELEEDGLIVTLSYIAFIGTLFFFAFIFVSAKNSFGWLEH